jgi:hypothetical protein
MNRNPKIVGGKVENGCAGLFIETDKPLPLSAIRTIPLPEKFTNFWRKSKTYQEPSDVLKKTRCDAAFLSCESKTRPQSDLLHTNQNFKGICGNLLSTSASENKLESSSSLCECDNLEKRNEQNPNGVSFHYGNHFSNSERDKHALTFSKESALEPQFFLDHPVLRSEVEIFERKVGMYSYFRRRWSRR